MTTVGLSAALSGLKAAQRSLDLISTNIANASTPGYTRKILPQEALVVGGAGLGVKLQAVIRNVDKSLLGDVFKQYSISQNFATQEDYLSRIQDFHGASNAGRSISTRIGALADAFSALSSAPDSTIQLSKTLAAAQQTVRTFNEFSELILDMRNETQDEIAAGVAKVNEQLKVIASLNIQISTLTAQGRSAADLEDQRDMAIKSVSEYMQISTYPADNNKIVVMTRQGHTLVDETARQLNFQRNNAIATSYYPGGGLAGLYIGTPPAAGAVDVTDTGLGGKFGALFELRDETLPSYQAQIDEMAQKMAQRFDAQGLRLFTDGYGNVPPNVADPGIVGYVGFASSIQVNAQVVADPNLIRSGTYGQTVPTGSNEIIRKISTFALGPYAYQQAQGTADISAGTLFASLGLTQQNQLIGTVDLTDYAPDLDAAPNITAPANFTITLGVTPYNITINPGDTATDLVNAINTAVGSPVATLNGLGQLRLNSTQDITLANGTLGALGMGDLGLTAGVYPAQNPSFEIQVGTQSPITVTIDPLDTSTDLLNTLNAISGITASLGPGGVLVVTPDQGGDLTMRNLTGTPLTAMGVVVSNVAHTAFRQNNLGPDGASSTSILSLGTVEDYARDIITSQAGDHAEAKDRMEKEQVYFETLDKRNTDQSGVDIDQEISELVRIQTAYSAAARMISATEKMFDELLAAFV